MPDTKISDMTAASALTGAEVVPVLQGGSNKRTTTQDIADLGSAGITQLTGDSSVVPGCGSQSVTVVQARGLRETGGPTTLAMGAVTDGQGLRRSGSTVVGVDLLTLTSSAASNLGRTASAGSATAAAKADHVHDGGAINLNSTVSSSTTLPDKDAIPVDTTSGAVNLTLDGGTSARRWEIYKINAGANTITLVRAASETIQGTGANVLLPDSDSAEYPSWTIIRDASGNYRVL